MTRLRAISTILGVLLVSAVGLYGVTRAQAPAPPTGRAALRDRIVGLRTEVDLLQLEHDAARANLIETLQGMEKADLLGIDLPSLLGTAKLEIGGLSGNAESLRGMSNLSKALEGDDRDQALGAMKKTLAKQKEEFLASLKRKREEYARQARALNEKKWDLAEVEGSLGRPK